MMVTLGSELIEALDGLSRGDIMRKDGCEPELDGLAGEERARARAASLLDAEDDVEDD